MRKTIQKLAKGIAVGGVAGRRAAKRFRKESKRRRPKVGGFRKTLPAPRPESRPQQRPGVPKRLTPVPIPRIGRTMEKRGPVDIKQLTSRFRNWKRTPRKGVKTYE